LSTPSGYSVVFEGRTAGNIAGPYRRFSTTAKAKGYRLFSGIGTLALCAARCDMQASCLGIFFFIVQGADGPTKCYGLSHLGREAGAKTKLNCVSLVKDPIAATTTTTLASTTVAAMDPLDVPAGYVLSFSGDLPAYAGAGDKRRFSTAFDDNSISFTGEVGVEECARQCSADPSCAGFFFRWVVSDGQAAIPKCITLNSLGASKGKATSTFSYSLTKIVITATTTTTTATKTITTSPPQSTTTTTETTPPSTTSTIATKEAARCVGKTTSGSGVPCSCEPLLDCYQCRLGNTSAGVACEICKNGKYLQLVGDSVCLDTCPPDTVAVGEGNFNRICVTV